MLNSQVLRNDPVQRQLWQAAKDGDVSQIRIAIMNGADLHMRDEEDRTASHIASQYGHAEALKTLISAKKMAYFAQVERDAGLEPVYQDNRPSRKSA